MPSPGRRSTARVRCASCARDSGASASGGKPCSASAPAPSSASRRSGFIEIDTPESRSAEGLRGPLIVARSDFAPAGHPHVARAGGPAAHLRWRHGRVDHSRRRSRGTPTFSAPSQEIDGLLLRGAFDLDHGAGAAARARLRRLPHRRHRPPAGQHHRARRRRPACAPPAPTSSRASCSTSVTG